MSGLVPTPEFLADLEALCRKHGVSIYGADYHDGILLGTWTEGTNIVVAEDNVIEIYDRS